jgi:hypothetical protein
MKKALLIGLGIGIALIVGVFVIGFFLPETYRAQVQFNLQRPPEEVWAAVADYQKHPLGGAAGAALPRGSEHKAGVGVQSVGEW